MAKDPAVLFYTSDFLSGTSFMSDEQTGIYIRLLCQQHQLGEIPKIFFNEKTINHDIIKLKFIETETGYYNVKMKNEADRRKKFCASRKESISKRYDNSTYVDTYVDTCVERTKLRTNIRMETETKTRNTKIKDKLNTNTKEEEEKEKPSLFKTIISRFCTGYEKVKGAKYREVQRDVKILKEFLSLNTDMTEDHFFDIVNLCIKDSFHCSNLSIRYVCNNFSKIETKETKENDSN